MIAYHGKPEIKQMYLDRVRAHRAADEIIHGTYWELGKGCAVGCTIHSGDHAAYETELGIPTVLALLEDRIFEGLASPHDKKWPERFLNAIEPGADLSLVWPRFACWLLSEELKAYETKESRRVMDLYSRLIRGDCPSEREWREAAAAAADAADAADADADAAAAAAADAAYAADADADAAAAAYAYKRMSDKLIELLEEAP